MNLQDIDGPSAGWKTVENTMTKTGKVVIVDMHNKISNFMKLLRYHMSTCHMKGFKMK